MNTPTNAAMRTNLKLVREAIVALGHYASVDISRGPAWEGWERAMQLRDEAIAELDAAQPAQAGEAVAELEVTEREHGRFVKATPMRYGLQTDLPVGRYPLYLHPQPEQPASDERLTVAEVATLLGRKGLDVLKALQRHGVIATLNQRIDFKDALLAASWLEQPASAVCEHCKGTGGYKYLSAACKFCNGEGTTQSPAVSPPSVVAVSEGDALLASCLNDDAALLRGLIEGGYEPADSLDEIADNMERAAVILASRMGS